MSRPPLPAWHRHAACAAALLACVACSNSHAQTMDVEVFHYSGAFVTTVEQPDSEQDCGEEYITYQANGYLSLNRAARQVRLEGFGCTLDVGEKAGTSLSGVPQDCQADGSVGFGGFGLDALRFDSIDVDPGAKATIWRARAWRPLASGRVSYCFDLNATLEPR